MFTVATYLCAAPVSNSPRPVTRRSRINPKPHLIDNHEVKRFYEFIDSTVVPLLQLLAAGTSCCNSVRTRATRFRGKLSSLYPRCYCNSQGVQLILLPRPRSRFHVSSPIPTPRRLATPTSTCTLSPSALVRRTSHSFARSTPRIHAVFRASRTFFLSRLRLALARFRAAGPAPVSPSGPSPPPTPAATPHPAAGASIAASSSLNSSDWILPNIRKF